MWTKSGNYYISVYEHEKDAGARQEDVSLSKRSSSNVTVIFVTIVLLTTGIWIVRIISGQQLYMDQLTRAYVEELAGTNTYTIFRWITELGSGTFLIPFVVIMSMVLWRLFRDWLPAVVFGLGTLSSYGLNILIKQLVERERPSIFIAANAEGYSFPSGHAMIPMVCYGFLAYLLGKNPFRQTGCCASVCFGTPNFFDRHQPLCD